MRCYWKVDFFVVEVWCFFEFGLVVLVSLVWKGQCDIMMMGWYMVLEFILLWLVIMIFSGNYSFGLICCSGECVINVFIVVLFDMVVGIGNSSGVDIDKFVYFGLDVVFGSVVVVLLIV